MILSMLRRNRSLLLLLSGNKIHENLEQRNHTWRNTNYWWHSHLSQTTFTPVYHPDGGFNVMIGFSIDCGSKKAQQDILKSRQFLKKCCKQYCSRTFGTRTSVRDVSAEMWFNSQHRKTLSILCGRLFWWMDLLNQKTILYLGH
jgi:hypothetical protein